MTLTLLKSHLSVYLSHIYIIMMYCVEFLLL